MIVTVGLTTKRDGKVLVQQRHPESRYWAGCWELPGGKVDQGETMREALAREWWEELGVRVTVGQLLHEVVYSFENAPHCLLPLFAVHLPVGSPWPKAREGQRVEWMPLERVLHLHETERCTPTMELYAPAIKRYAQDTSRCSL